MSEPLAELERKAAQLRAEVARLEAEVAALREQLARDEAGERSARDAEADEVKRHASVVAYHREWKRGGP